MPLRDLKKRAEYRHAYYLANREKILEQQKEYIKANPDVADRRGRTWTKNHPEKRRAHWYLNYAIWKGKLVKPKACPRCGRIGIIDGHHSDYSKPLEVEWLCRPCHTKQHAQDNEQRDNTHEQ